MDAILTLADRNPGVIWALTALAGMFSLHALMGIWKHTLDLVDRRRAYRDEKAPTAERLAGKHQGGGLTERQAEKLVVLHGLVQEARAEVGQLGAALEKVTAACGEIVAEIGRADLGRRAFEQQALAAFEALREDHRSLSEALARVAQRGDDILEAARERRRAPRG